ncbi:MAG: hypothetical protein H6696_06315 [Deferribacteres bacterium]|nr:hypothetical protein [candidate division KSB1 bacterium]MCB9501533.1 hypothetical protein [Deferribacteres bacterium]
MISQFSKTILIFSLPLVICAQNELKLGNMNPAKSANTVFQIENREAPAGGTVFLKSLLIPGWGQASLGANHAKRNFLISEALLLGSAIGFSTYRSWVQDDYIAYASSHAQVDPSGKDGIYWADIGDYLSIYEYNEAWLRRRSLDDLRDPQSNDFWEWDNLENAQKYRAMRIDADKAKTWSQFAIAGVITNHVVSALHALWLKRKQVRDENAFQQNYIFALQATRGSKGGILRLSIHF